MYTIQEKYFKVWLWPSSVCAIKMSYRLLTVEIDTDPREAPKKSIRNS